MISHKRIIHPNFVKKKNGFLNKFIGNRNHFFVSSGRGGLELVIDKLDINQGHQVLLPAFSPQGVVRPFKKKKIEILYYKLSKTLSPDLDDIKYYLKNNNVKIILFIHYFGFPQNINRLKEIKNGKTFIIEDCAHGFLSTYKKGSLLGSFGDIALFSFPKIIPVPDGSLFVINNPDITIKSINYKSSFWAKLSFYLNRLLIKFRSYFFHKDKNVNKFIYNLITKSLHLIYYISKNLQNNPTEISKFSLSILKHYDYKKLINRRIKNTLYVYNNINKEKYNLLYSEYFNYVITGVPILAKNRDMLREKLKKHNIETLSYKKFWLYYPTELKHRYLEEIKIHNSLLLLPINEYIPLEKIKLMVNILNNSIDI